MGKWAKLRQRILLGQSDANISFVDLCGLLSHYGFKGRIKGSHHIFSRHEIDEIINLQPNGRAQRLIKFVRFECCYLSIDLKHTMTKYELIIYWSDVDQAFLVEVPELPGCMADGPTREQALKNAERVIDLWIETAKNLNRPIPEPKGRLAYA